jgi:glyoxylase-like metal-dependent hydrolase (beta-lactamase superfamily II)
MTTQKQPVKTISIQRFTSSEAGSWSNAYLLSNETDAILFDVFMFREEAAELANTIEKSGKTLQAVMISHAHPDHFMGLDAIVEHFPSTRIVSTPNVVADIENDGPWMLSLLQNKLGPRGPKRLVVPEPLTDRVLHLGDTKLDIVEFGECECKHIAAVYIPTMQAFLSADLVYNGAHLYVAEKHIASWLERLDEIVAFAQNPVATIYPGHGPAGDIGLVAQTRAYLNDFAEAVQSGDADVARQQILTKYPQYHARQFLTVFSIPAFFPTQTPAA